MSNTKEKKKKDPVIIVLDLIIVLMVFVLIGITSQLLLYYDIDKDTSTFTQDGSGFSYSLEKNDYARIIQGKYMNEINNIKNTEQFHALGDYIEAASLHKVYVEKGYDDKVKEQENIMDESRKEMGNLTIFADKVDKQFEVN